MTVTCIAAIATAFLLAQSAASAATPVQLECDIISFPTRDTVTHILTIDLDHKLVVDGPMRFIDGGASEPFPVTNLIAFVKHDGRLVQWGNAERLDGKPVTVFSVDLGAGSYTLTGRFSQSAKGHCHAMPNAT